MLHSLLFNMLRQRLDKYGHGSKKTHLFVSVFADWAAARAHSDSVPGLAGSRRSWWLHWFPGFCGSGTIQAGGTGSAHGGALQVQMRFLCLTWTRWDGVDDVTFQKLHKYYCSAGIGRTGVLITMETALCLMECGQPVYPLEIVRTMRDQRAMMIQTPVCPWMGFTFSWGTISRLLWKLCLNLVSLPEPVPLRMWGHPEGLRGGPGQTAQDRHLPA